MSLLRFFKILGATTAVTTNVPQNTLEVSLLPDNANRKGFKIVNDSNNKLIIKYASGISSTSYTYVLNKKDTLIENEYFGEVYGYWDNAGVGNAVITETIY